MLIRPPRAVLLAVLLAVGSSPAVAQQAAEAPERRNGPAMHCQMIQTGEIQAVVGDCSRDGMGGPQYCGLWSLTSKQRPFNCYGNSYAGLIPGELRGKTAMLEVIDEVTVALRREVNDAYPSDARAVYRLVGPDCIEHTLSVRDAKPLLRADGYREVSWCSYINSPEDPKLYFVSGGEWTSYLSPTHGIGSRIAPSHLPEEQLEPLAPQDEDRRPFHHDWAPVRFDEPFYYGRLGKMALIHVFDNATDLRFFCSPSGGGASLLANQYCPAWDFLWVIPADRYASGEEYRFRLRLIYKPFVSDEDVLGEVRRAQAEMKAAAAG
jgi:hypothetical protein